MFAPIAISVDDDNCFYYFSQGTVRGRVCTPPAPTGEVRTPLQDRHVPQDTLRSEVFLRFHHRFPLLVAVIRHGLWHGKKRLRRKVQLRRDETEERLVSVCNRPADICSTSRRRGGDGAATVRLQRRRCTNQQRGRKR